MPKGPASWFRRTSLREALHAAEVPDLAGWKLVCPSGLMADVVHVAVTPWKRMRGLLGRRPLAPGEALVIQPCSQVHTIGMRFPIDAVFCDPDLRVLAVRTLEPQRLSPHLGQAWCCVELPAGTAERCDVVPGVQLELVRPQDPVAASDQ